VLVYPICDPSASRTRTTIGNHVGGSRAVWRMGPLWEPSGLVWWDWRNCNIVTDSENSATLDQIQPGL